MIGHLAQAGMSLTPDPELADVLIVNTCSFIDMAKQESIDAIFGAVKDRAEDPDRARQKIIVAGCLSQRFAKDLPGIMPEVDAFIGLDQITKVAPIIENLLGKKNAAEVSKDEGPAATDDPLFAYLDQLVLSRDGVRVFRGWITGAPVQAEAAAEQGCVKCSPS